MIYPTRAAILTAMAGAPIALVLAVLLPGIWYAGLAWPVAVMGVALVDAVRGPRPRDARLAVRLPQTGEVGTTITAHVEVTIAGAQPPRAAELALALDALLEAPDEGRLTVRLLDGQGSADLALDARRRGTTRIAQGWLRWRGPLGLVWKQRRLVLDASLAILPNTRAVSERGARLIERRSLEGLVVQAGRGSGAEFESLVEYQQGMDRRAIDWRQSARHMKLHAKQYREERNNQILFAIDAGRQMSEPIGGLPRVDRAVSAALLAAWVALKLGDRVGLFAFDGRPRVASGLVSGASAYAQVQRLAARIDYSGEEANYTLALTTLAARLDRRSLIILFTEFADLTSAEFMLRAVGRLIAKHLLLVVVLVDEELDALVAARPETPDDVTRTVTAAALLRERRLVLSRLRHLGVHIIESEHDRVDERLVAGYLDLKRPGAAVSVPAMNATLFRAAHEAEWERLDRLVTTAEKRSVRALDADALLALPLLYRTTLSSLSVVRETSLDRGLADYLEQLCTRAYFLIYGVRTSPWRRLGTFFRSGWPAAVSALWRETIVAALFALAGVIVGYLLVLHDASWFYAIIPEGYASGRDPSASADTLRQGLYTGEQQWLATFAAFLFTHNAQMSILAFALGFAVGAPTALLLILNGVTLGAFLALYVPKGLGVAEGGWLMIHGSTELFAMVLSGAAGFRIGLAVAFPGRAARLDAAVAAGRTTALAMIGVVIMLAVAGLLEGVGRQTVTSDGARYTIAIVAFVGWSAYFYLPRGRHAAR